MQLIGVICQVFVLRTSFLGNNPLKRRLVYSNATFDLTTSAFRSSGESFQRPRASAPVGPAHVETWHKFLWVDVTAQNNLNGASELHKFLHLESGPLGKYTIYAYF